MLQYLIFSLLSKDNSVNYIIPGISHKSVCQQGCMLQRASTKLALTANNSLENIHNKTVNEVL